ncbi:MAG TPA: OsmC family protein [Candidatus Limnocylindrales bacterium]|nr:OsmC family protein [Candidatus Limnocylindrales bacterium]
MSHSEHRFACRLVWTGAAQGPTTDYATYSREVRVEIPGKEPIRISAAGAFRGDAALPNPEDLLIASLASCHFLSYVALCARNGIHVVAYEDDASGVMTRGEHTFHFTDVLLRPRVTIAPESDAARARALHAQAHHECFIAASVNFPVRNEPTIIVASPV